MFCGFICVGLALSAILTPSPEGTKFQQQQIDAFVAMVEQQLPGVLRGDDRKTALREQLIQLSIERTLPAKFRARALLPWLRPDEQALRVRAVLLAEQAARALRHRDAPEYLRTIGTFYAEVGGYAGERAGLFIKSYLSNIAYPMIPSLMVAGGVIMSIDPEICGVKPDTILNAVLIGLGGSFMASYLPVFGTKWGRARFMQIGSPEVDQLEGARRVTEAFWIRVREIAGEDVGPANLTGPEWRPGCEGLFLEDHPLRLPCATKSCEAGA